jgi:methanogenic corrinoid protein MtbC1
MVDLKELTKAVGELDEEKVQLMLTEFVASNPSEEDAQAAVNACQEGMKVVGDLYERSEYFVGDLIFAGELLSTAINSLKPVLASENKSNAGSIILGTVHGDLHDIGKNIFKTMAEAAGFVVYDLGIDLPASAFVEKVKEIGPVIVGLSGVLTLALDAMKQTVDLIKEEGLRDSVKIIIGGNPVSAEACKHIGADAYTTNAAEGVKICQRWVSN